MNVKNRNLVNLILNFGEQGLEWRPLDHPDDLGFLGETGNERGGYELRDPRENLFLKTLATIRTPLNIQATRKTTINPNNFSNNGYIEGF